MTASAYQQMTREAERFGFPRIFKTDLSVHDQGFLRKRNRPRQFGWLLRECGTDILLPNPWSFVQLEYFGRHPDAHWYWFDGKRLRQTTPQELLQLLRQQQSAVTPDPL